LFSKVLNYKKKLDVVRAVKALAKMQAHNRGKNKLRRKRRLLVMFVVCFMDYNLS